jgi:hypothetical protein
MRFIYRSTLLAIAFLFWVYQPCMAQKNVLIDLYNPFYTETTPLLTDSLHVITPDQDRFLRFQPLLPGQESRDFIDIFYFFNPGFQYIVSRTSEPSNFGFVYTFSNYNSFSNSTILSRQSIYGNPANNLFDSIIHEIQIDNIWMPQQKSVQIFGNGGLLNQRTEFSWNQVTQQWTPASQTDYIYDAQLRLTFRTTSNWNGGAWLTNNKYYYTYPSNAITETWYNLNGQTYLPIDSTYYWLDSNQKYDSLASWSWLNGPGLWVETNRILYLNTEQKKARQGKTIKINTNGNRIEVENWLFAPGDGTYTDEPELSTRQVKANNIAWLDQEKINIAYELLSDGRVYGTRTQTELDNTTGEWIPNFQAMAWFRKQEDVGTTAPFNDVLQCNLPSMLSTAQEIPLEWPSQWNIYHIDGRLAAQQNDFQSTLNIPLSPGIYVVHLRSQGQTPCVQKLFIKN